MEYILTSIESTSGNNEQAWAWLTILVLLVLGHHEAVVGGRVWDVLEGGQGPPLPEGWRAQDVIHAGVEPEGERSSKTDGGGE